MTREWKTGDRLENRWEILKVMKGGMGVVYVVHDHEWNEAYAAKTFQDSVLARNPRIAAMFTREALAWVQLDAHPNIAQAMFVKEIEGKPVLFLEYVSGGDLSGWVGTARLTHDSPQVLRFAIAFCDGMIHARAKGIQAHRDIKPQNCLIAGDGTLKVTDFGLAKVFDYEGEERLALPEMGAISEEKLDALSFSRTGNAAGTVTHMAPEQFLDSKRVGVEADVYSFGVMLFQMLTGRLPFAGRTWDEFEEQHRNHAPAVEQVQNAELRAVVERCLRKAPQERWRDFEAVREVLGGIYRNLTGKEVVPPVTGRALDVRQWLNKGVSLAALGFPQEAMGCYEKALEIDPGYAEVWANKGNIFKESGKPVEAMTCYQRALQMKPELELAWYNMGGTLDKLGRTAEALECLEKALSLNPLFDMAWSSRGVLLGRLGRQEEALASFTQATRIHPRFAVGWAMMGNHYRTLGRLEDALACHERAVGFNPGLAEIWYNRGNVLSDLKRFPEALASYDKALELDGKLGSAWAGKGNVSKAQGRLDEALESYDRALAIDRRDARTWHNRGVTLQAAGRLEEALAAFTECLQIDPTDMDVWMKRGGVLDALDRAEEALAWYKAATKVDPRYALAWHNGGVAAKRLGRSEEALGLHEKALEIDPGLQEAWLGKANMLADLQRVDEAYAAYDHVLAMNPKFASAWYSKGATLGNAERYEEALACFERAEELGHAGAAAAVRVCRSELGAGAAPPPPVAAPAALPAPEDAEGWRKLAADYLRKGEYRESVACFERILELTPQAAGAWFGKSLAQQGLGQYAEAIGSMDTALSMMPELALGWNKKGELLVEGFQRFEEALACFERALTLGHAAAEEGIARCRKALGSQPAPVAADAETWIQRGADFDHAGDTDQALACYEKAIQTGPPLAKAWFGKGVVLGKVGRYDEELESYGKALELAPDFAGAWFNKGRTLGGRLKRYREAMECFEQARKLGHSGAEQAIAICQRGLAEEAAAAAPPPPPPISPQELVNQAIALAKEGRIDEGLARCQRVLDDNPRSALGWNGKAMVLIYADRYADALPFFEKGKECGGDPLSTQGIELCRDALKKPGDQPPVEAMALHEKGQALDARGREAEALACFESALALYPRGAVIWYDKGVVLGKLGRSAEEIAAYDEALAIDAGMATAWFNKGCTLAGGFQRYREAMECFEKAEALGYEGAQQGMNFCRKSMAEAEEAARSAQAGEAAQWHEKGTAIVVGRGSPAEALVCFEKALSLNGKRADSWWGKGVVLGQMGRLEESLAAFDGAIAVDPRMTGPWMSKAAALANANRLEEALPCFEKARELGDPTAVQGMIYCRQALGRPLAG